jgi:hypothetical protein
MNAKKAPDAWMRLVLETMGAEELRAELATASGDHHRWLAEELARKLARRCVICGKPSPVGYMTCAASECQEAAYRLRAKGGKR